MTRYFIVLSITLFSALALPAQKLNVSVDYIMEDPTARNTIIFYKPSQLLSWIDFAATPNNSSDAAAITNAGFGFKLLYSRYANNAHLGISVYCNFSKKDSWVKPGNKNNYILAHEQHHFDIAYIHTMLFIQRLRAAHFTTANYTDLVQKIYKESADEMSKMQDRYDTETLNSRSVSKQTEWNKRIENQLALTALK